MGISYTQVQQQFLDGQGNPLDGSAEFSVNVPLYSSGTPAFLPDAPVRAQITGGQLLNSTGGPLQLADLASTGLVIEGSQTGFWYWTASITVGGVVVPPWGFFLEHSGTPVDLYSLANTPAGGSGSGTVTSVSVVTANGLAGTVANPTSTPAITLETTVTGLLKGNGTAVSAAVANTDYAPSASPVLTGTPTAPTATPGTDSTRIASTAYADAAVAVETTRAEAAEALLAPKASPALTGTPTAPTATALTDSTQVATTAYADSAVAVETSRAEAAESALTTSVSGKVSRSGDTMTGPLSPKVVTLTDAATITVNAALGNEMRVTLGGSRTMGAPSNPVDGQVITFELVQDVTGSRTVTWTSGAGGYAFGSGTAPTMSTAAHAVDMVAFRYSAAADAASGAWCYLGSGLGY